MLSNRLLAVARVPALAVPAPGRARWTEARALEAALVRALRREQAPARTVQLALEANDAVTVLVRKLPLSVRCAAGSVWVTERLGPAERLPDLPDVAFALHVPRALSPAARRVASRRSCGR